MATTTAPARLEGRPHKWTTAEYEKLGAADVLSERTELIDGVIYDVSPHNPPHAFVVYLANRVLSRRFASTFAVLCQLPVRVPQHGMPEPDVMVLRPGSVRRDRLPDAADALLLVEVADSSLDADLQRKLPLYARAAVPELWVIEVRREVIRVFTEPRQGHYTAETEVARADRLHPRFSPEAALAAESFFAEDVDR